MKTLTKNQFLDANIPSLMLLMNFILVILISCVFINQANASTPNFTAEEKAWIKANPVITYGAGTNWYPYEYIDEIGKYQGISNDYLSYITSKTGLQFKPINMPWHDMLKKTEKGELDLLATVSKTKEREKTLTFANSHTDANYYIFVSDKFVQNNENASLSGKTIALVKGYSVNSAIRQTIKDANFIEVADWEDGLKMVQDGSATGFIETYGILHYLAGKQIHNIVPFQPFRINFKKRYRMASAIKNKTLINIINKVLDSASKKDFTTIESKWNGYKLNHKKNTLFSQEEESWIKAHPNVKVGIETTIAPYNMFNDQGVLVGVSQDYLNEISRYTGITFTPIQDNWSSLLKRAQNGESMILSAISETPERRKHLSFTEEYETEKLYFYIKNTYDQSKGLTNAKIALIKDYAMNEMIKARLPNANYIFVNSWTEAVTKLLDNQVDAVIHAEIVANAYFNKNNIMNVVPFQPESLSFDYHIQMAVPKRDAILASIVNKILQKLPAKEKDNIRQRWSVHTQRNSISKNNLFTKEEKQWISDHPEVTYGIGKNWYPYDFESEFGVRQGISQDYLHIVSKYTGLVFKPVFGTWSSIYQ